MPTQTINFGDPYGRGQNNAIMGLMAGNMNGLDLIGGTTDSTGRMTQQFGHYQDPAALLKMREDANNRASDRMENLYRELSSSMSAAPIRHVERGVGANADMERAARDASFARAKDQAGQIARSSIESLQDTLGGRGMLGSGAETKGLERIMAGGQANLGEVTRERAIQDASHAEHVADVNYQGEVQQALAEAAQRNQMMQSLLSLVRQSGAIY